MDHKATQQHPCFTALIANQARTVKNGHIHTGKQRYLGRNCGRQFIKNPTNKVIDTPTRTRIDRVLLERIWMVVGKEKT